MQSELRRLLGNNVGAEELIDDPVEAAALASDVYMAGTALGALRCRSADSLSRAMAILHRERIAMVPRGGGMSYTGGYVPARQRSVIIDTSAMDRIIEISAANMLITVEAGVTWKAMHEALQPLGLRLPFFGTFSGAKATVGGGLSNGALFLGTARYGTAADCMLGLEVMLADGTRVRTGQSGFEHVDHCFYRTYGPDLAGLFTHDCGTLGVKIAATFRLIETPLHSGYASFVFAGPGPTAAALSAVARTGAAEEAYVFDPASTRKNLDANGIKDDLKTLTKVIRNERSLLKGLKSGMQLALGGKDIAAREAYSLHVVATGRTEAAMEADLDACREAALKAGGAEIVNSIPKAVRAGLFPHPNGVLGPKGDRWAALNAKVPHSGAMALIDAAAKLLAPHEARMQELGVWMSYLYIAVGNHAFSFEPVFHWFDEWLPMHERTPERAFLADLRNPAPNPAARQLVDELRRAMTRLFVEHGAASNQIGKTYRYREGLRAETRDLLDSLKRSVDPLNLMNPGALGFDR